MRGVRPARKCTRGRVIKPGPWAPQDGCLWALLLGWRSLEGRDCPPPRGCPELPTHSLPTYFLLPQNLQWARDVLLGSGIPWQQLQHMPAQGLFCERNKTNFFNVSTLPC